MKRIMILICLLLFALMLTPIIAQEDATTTCTGDDYAAQLAAALDAVQSADDPTAEYAAQLTALAELEATCAGLSWSSDVDGLQPVIGPVQFEPGVYTVTITVGDLFIVNFTPLTETCGFDIERQILISDGGEHIQNIVEVEGDCSALMEMNNPASSDWSIRINKLG